MTSMMRAGGVALAFGLALASAAPCVAAVPAATARRAAIAILLGDPYGSTAAAVDRTIVSQTLMRDDACHTRKQVWKFRVVVPPSRTSPDGIDGYLVLDAANGKLVCAGLPFLD